jgi:hypothetical protein
MATPIDNTIGHSLVSQVRNFFSQDLLYDTLINAKHRNGLRNSSNLCAFEGFA